MKDALTIVLVVLAVAAACSPKARSRSPFVEDVGGITDAGAWRAPAWVAHPPDERQRIVDEFNFAASSWGETGLELVVLPGEWTSGDNRVAGQFLEPSTLLVAYGQDGDRALLPALPHEVLHCHLYRTTGDPDASHASPLWAKLPVYGGRAK